MVTHRVFGFSFALVLCLLSGTRTDAANQHQYKFPNEEGSGVHANDLHIEFDREVEFSGTPTQEPADTFKNANGDGDKAVDLAEGETGSGVDGGAAGDDAPNVVLTFEYTGEDVPVILKWQWTNGNTVNPSANNFIGEPKEPKGKDCSFSGEGATGDGSIIVTVDGTESTFELGEDELPSEAAARFKTFIEDLEYGVVFPSDDDTLVSCTATAYGSDSISITVTPDSSMTIDVTEFVLREPELFLRGDADGNGTVFPIVDALYLLVYGFTDGAEPPCLRAADIDGNGSVFSIVDALYLLIFAFTDGPEPPAPGPNSCGVDGDSWVSCEVTDTCS